MHQDGILVTRRRSALEQRAWDGACDQLACAFHGRIEPCKAHRVVTQVGEEVRAGGVMREGVVWLVWFLIAELSEIRRQLADAALAAVEPRDKRLGKFADLMDEL
jgi:hypothetical protein